MPPTSTLGAKTRMRYEKIARYRATNRYTDAHIAGIVGLTPGGLAQAILSQEYKDIEAEVFKDHLENVESGLREDEEEIREAARAAVPLALRTLVNAVTQSKDLRTAVAAAKLLIENDPNRTLTSSARGSASGNGGGEGPQLPESVITHLTIQSNKVVTEIRTGVGGDTTTITAMAQTPAPAAQPKDRKHPLVMQEEGEA